MHPRWNHQALSLFASLLLLVATCARVLAEEQPAAPAIDPQAAKVLSDWGKYTAQLQGFSATIKASMEARQGELSQEREVTTQVTAQRPNKLSLNLKTGQDSADLVCDGKSLTVSLTTAKKYFIDETAERVSSWSKILENPIAAAIITQGNAGAIMAALFADDPNAKLLSSIESATYGGEVMLDGTKCHLIQAVGKDTDWQLWIDAGPKPLLRQFVPDLNKAMAKLAAAQGRQAPADLRIKSTSVFTDWKENPTLAADTFAFSPPLGAVKIDNPADQVEPLHPLLGKVAPPINLDLLGGGKLDLASLKDKNIVILDFWATWCGPCKRAMPIIEKVADEYKKKGVRLYAVNLEESAEDVQHFAEQSGITATIALDSAGTAARDYQAQAIPQTVLVGKNGTVQVVHVGLLPDLENQLRKELDALLAGKDLAAEAKAKAEKGKPSAAEPVTDDK
ncbi:MAG TPA: DUF2092 domain-containing protein [Pirellulales bacterium]|nr:DUF2092 domain-containing protein [Pirellulales bacterium]